MPIFLSVWPVNVSLAGKVLISAFFSLPASDRIKPQFLYSSSDKLTAAHSFLKVVNTKIISLFFTCTVCSKNWAWHNPLLLGYWIAKDDFMTVMNTIIYTVNYEYNSKYYAPWLEPSSLLTDLQLSFPVATRWCSSISQMLRHFTVCLLEWCWMWLFFVGCSARRQ